MIIAAGNKTVITRKTVGARPTTDMHAAGIGEAVCIVAISIARHIDRQLQALPINAMSVP